VSVGRQPWWAGVVVGLALLEGGWLAFDGAHALLLGDYVTPSGGRFARQLGPWANLVRAVGLEPRSTAVKVIHLGLGAAWLVAVVWFVRGGSRARLMLIACAVASLWYLPFGTALSVVLILLTRRSARAP